MRTLLLAFMVTTLTNCAGVSEVTIKKHSSEYSLSITRRTGKVFLVGHGGFFIREASYYAIALPDNNGIVPFNKLKVEKNDILLTINGGHIEFIDKGRLTISLTQEYEGKTVGMEINGTFALDN